jgi:hypothetical protein
MSNPAIEILVDEAMRMAPPPPPPARVLAAPPDPPISGLSNVLP